MQLSAARKDCSYRSLSHDRNIPQDLYHKNLNKLRDLQLSPMIEKIKSDGIETIKYEKVGEEKITTNSTMINVKL
jgi:hypothetical protein